MAIERPLSKSQYVRALQCHKALYLYRNNRELMSPVSAADQMTFDQGTYFGELARKRFGNGILVEEDHKHLEEAVETTRKLIEKGATLLYEAAFKFDDVVVRVDVIELTEGRWKLYEVKSTTKVEDTHLDDVAVQRYVMHGAGYIVSHAAVVHADSEYVRRGDLNLVALFKITDVSAETDAKVFEVARNIAAMKAMLGASEPETPIGAHCTKPYPCAFQGHCWKDVPEHSVFDLAYAQMPKKVDLWHRGIQTVAEIPAGEKLSANQERQVRVAKSGIPIVSTVGIREILHGLSYPRYFLDFETINPAVPLYDGTSPFEQVPFEASLHVQAHRGAPLYHFEFIGDGIADPRRGLTEFLLEHIGQSGSVVAYHKSFEGGCLERLGAWFGGSHGGRITDIVGRLWDLADFFRKGIIVLPEFHGSWSIKKVLPALVPGAGYQGLAIADGAAAMAAYYRLLKPGYVSEEERAKILADLKTYCAKDTMAMVDLLAVVENMALTGAGR